MRVIAARNTTRTRTPTPNSESAERTCDFAWSRLCRDHALRSTSETWKVNGNERRQDRQWLHRNTPRSTRCRAMYTLDLVPVMEEGRGQQSCVRSACLSVSQEGSDGAPLLCMRAYVRTFTTQPITQVNTVTNDTVTVGEDNGNLPFQTMGTRTRIESEHHGTELVGGIESINASHNTTNL